MLFAHALEVGGALVAVGGQPLDDLVSAEAEELQPEEASKIGCAVRYQWLRDRLVQLMALVGPAARTVATRSASVCTSASSTHLDTRPIRSASSPVSASQVSR